MAYLLCLFERLLIHFKCDKEQWKWILERFWQYTEYQYLDEWMYEIAEFLPNNILSDPYDAFEFITEEEYYLLKTLYQKNCTDINLMMNIIFDMGTSELYSRLENNSPYTLMKLQEAIKIVVKNNILLICPGIFEEYSFSQENGWGKCFNGKKWSLFL